MEFSRRKVIAFVGALFAVNTANSANGALSRVSGFGAVDSIVWSPDGSALVTVNGPFLTLWDLITKKRRRIPLKQRARFRAISFSRDGLRLLLGTEFGDVFVCNVKTGEIHDSYSLGSTTVVSIVEAADGVIFAGLWDGKLTLRRGKARPVLVKQAHLFGWVTLSASADGQIIASCGDDQKILFWNARTGEKIGSLTADNIGEKAMLAQIAGISFLPGNRFLSWAVNGVHWPIMTLWDLKTGEILRQGAQTKDPSGINLLSLNRAGSLGIYKPLLGSSTLILFDIKNWIRLWKKDYGATSNPTALAISPSGHIVAVGQKLGGIEFIEPQGGSLLLSLYDDLEETNAYSPDGTKISLSNALEVVARQDNTF
mgnify:CR=1 FL=1